MLFPLIPNPFPSPHAYLSDSLFQSFLQDSCMRKQCFQSSDRLLHSHMGYWYMVLLENKTKHNNRLTIDWPQSRVIGRSIKSHPSGKTSKLYIESHSGVSILVTVVITAITGHRELLITHVQPSHEHFHVSRMNGWIAIWQVFETEYFPQFRGNKKWTSLQSVRVPLCDCLGIV